MKYFGPHVSIAGGLFNAPDRAAALGATGFALFTKNQRQWMAPPLSDEECAAFKERCAAHGYTPAAILPHDSYLINLGNPDAEKRRKATAAFTAELKRVEALGLSMLNFHPGSGLNETDTETTLLHIAEGIRAALSETRSAVAVIENTAGQGSVTGRSLEELQRLLELVDSPDRCGVCIDTCHADAAGYALASEEGYTRFFEEFGRRIGFKNLRGMHLNDAKAETGSHLDRHAPLGQGTLGKDLFRRLAQDDRLDGIPMILETPDETLWAQETAFLKESSESQ